MDKKARDYRWLITAYPTSLPCLSPRGGRGRLPHFCTKIQPLNPKNISPRTLKSDGLPSKLLSCWGIPQQPNSGLASLAQLIAHQPTPPRGNSISTHPDPKFYQTPFKGIRILQRAYGPSRRGSAIGPKIGKAVPGHLDTFQSTSNSIP